MTTIDINIPDKCMYCKNLTWLQDDIVHGEWWCMHHNMSCESEHSTCKDKKEMMETDSEY